MRQLTCDSCKRVCPWYPSDGAPYYCGAVYVDDLCTGLLDERRFPIHPNDRAQLDSVPWSLVAAHERQAARNHGVSLACLAENGGLTLIELAFVLLDRPYMAASPSKASRNKVKQDALRYIKERVKAHEAATAAEVRT